MQVDKVFRFEDQHPPELSDRKGNLQPTLMKMSSKKGILKKTTFIN